MSIRDVELIWPRRVLVPALLLFYCVCLISVLIDATGVFAAQHGVARVVQLALEGHLAAGVLVAMQCAIGANLLRAFGRFDDGDPLLERFLFSLIIGFQVVVGAALALAALGHLEAGWMLLTFALLMVGSWGLASRRGAPPVRFRTGAFPASHQLVWLSGALALVAVVAWLWPLAVQTALPNSDWDSALYHLPLAERYLQGNVWNSDPLFSAHSFPGGISLVYAIFLGLGLEHAIIPFNFVFVLLTLAAVYALGRRLAGPACGVWSMFVCAGIHALWQQGVDPRVDGFLSFFVVVAALALVATLVAPRDRTPHVVAGLSVGLAIGTKYTGVFIFGAFGLAWIAVSLWRNARGARAHLGAAGALAFTLVLLPHGVWYASSVAIHGDPLFPMLRGDYYQDASRAGERLAMSGALDRYLEDLSPEAERLARQLEPSNSVALESNLFDLAALYRSPERYSTKPNHFVSPLLMLCLALPFVLPANRERRMGAIAVGGLGLVCFVGIASQTNLIRYALPFLTLLAVASGLVIARCSHPVWRLGWLAAGCALLLSNHQAEDKKLDRLHPEHLARVDGDRLQWLGRVGYNFTPAMPSVIRRINARIESGEMSPRDRIMLIGEGKGRLLACDSLPDLSWFLQRFAVELLRAELDHERVFESLDQQGITHILYNPGYFRWVGAHTSVSKPQLAFTMLQLDAFLERHGEVVLEAAGMKLVRLARHGTGI
ncbi:MAG: glycosyltransferase family 39 protein [Myxococcota bacterium]|nr:glycosyltransferase family 39 protein [Myxococcota bacterium]